MVRFTEPAGIVPDLGREEAEGRGQWYIGPEHLLVGLLRQDDNPAATLLREHGLDLATVRAGIDRLVGQGVLPGPRPDDAELLATLGIDLAAALGHIQETFGDLAYYDAAGRARLRPVSPVPHTPMTGTPLVRHQVLLYAAREAATRDQEVGPLHLLLGCCGTPRTRSRPACIPRSGDSGACSASPTTAPARSGCWSRARG
jgi:Clp amino terminal domain, pathogenicity island component